MSERLAAAIARPGRHVLLYVDLDGFKSVNDTYGHTIGDRLLCIVAAGFQQLADGALLARLGGDEFAAMLTGGDAVTRAETLAADIVKFLREPFDIEGRSCCVGASIGLAKAEAGVDVSEIMRRADVAMYDAKEQGRGLWRWFNPELDARKAGDQQLAAEMRKLVGRGSFAIAYQPIVSAASREITGVEALARWPQPSSFNPTPDSFIRIAEENGIIDDLGALILRLACRDAARWRGISLSVNVSPLQLNSRSFVATVKRIAEEEGFDLARLEMEFTETILIRNAQRAREVLRELHDLGIKVALDDFGTGFASIGYLRSFAFDRVKLDRSLTKGVGCDDSTQKIVQGTVLIAQGLSADIVAEGVEAEEQAQILRLTGCGHLQGHHLGKPGPAAALDEALRGADEGQVAAAG
jgi:diguanylate cyclase (GGDEF)-like protein